MFNLNLCNGKNKQKTNKQTPYQTRTMSQLVYDIAPHVFTSLVPVIPCLPAFGN